MNIIELYNDFGISYVTEGHKHTRPNWVNTECPFCCGNPGYHLGYDTVDNKFVCWRCGGKTAWYALSGLLNVSINKAKEIIKKYDGNVYYLNTPEPKIKVLKNFRLPPHTELQKQHKNYLINRQYDPDLLEKTWGLLGTGVDSVLDKIDYKHRILIPYIWNDKIVSFDARAISKNNQFRYMACHADRETINHKHILYGKQSAWTDTGICVEGCTDVWRMGVNSFAVSGIKYTPQQIRIIAKTFKRVALFFDPEPQAQEQAKKLINELKFRGVDAFNVTGYECDAGDLPQNEADYIVKQIIK